MSRILEKQVYLPKVVEAFKDKKMIAYFNKSVDEYLNRNAAALTTSGPTEKVLFTDTDKDVLFNVTEVDQGEFKAILKSIPGVKSQLNVIKNPYYTLNAVVTRYAIITKNEEFKKRLLTMMVMSMYPSLQTKYFKFLPNKDMMDYTINNLSNKYKIKQHGVFFFALMDIADGALKLHESRLIKGEDALILAYVIDVKTRLNSVFRKLSNEFYDNVKKGVYLSKEEDNFDEDNYYEYDSNTYAISRITQHVTNYLVVNGPNMKIVDASAKMNQVSISELRNYTTAMVNKDHMSDITKLVENIVTLYLIDGKHLPQQINTTDFIIFSLDIYRTSNVKNTQILEIKDILDRWMRDLGTYEKTNRKATINNFRRALYCFFVYSIQHANMQ